MKRFVIGDIHGGFRAMKQVLERANFDPEKDMLIGLGDYADGWPDVYEVVAYLMKLPNFKGVIANHDVWLLDFLTYGATPHIWISQGGQASFDSYKGFLYEANAELHRKFLASLPYYLEIDDKLFVHGGVYVSNNGVELRAFSNEDLIWDRSLFRNTVSKIIYGRGVWDDFDGDNLSPYKEVYIGHTTTQMADPTFKPMSYGGIYLLDQGGGWDGKLTVMDIDTKEYWQSDFVPELYPEVKGRG